jgi:N-carbamoyl-L-amino-acid hydrolase
MAAALSNLFADFPGMATRPLGFPVVAFVEAYIEQGPELDQPGDGR